MGGLLAVLDDGDQATELETRDVVAIKKVLQDKRFKNRELQIMKQLVKQPHPNIVLLKQCFYSNGEKPEELYLNLVGTTRQMTDRQRLPSLPPRSDCSWPAIHHRTGCAA